MATKVSDKSFTGRTRHRATSSSVKLIDMLARGTITLGGIGTILAVSGVFLYLVYVAVPLFFPASIEDSVDYTVPWSTELGEPLHVVMDEYQVIGYAMFRDGSVRVFDVRTGLPIGEALRPLGDRVPTAWCFSTDATDASFGFDDGSAVIATFEFQTRFIPEDELSAALLALPVGESMVEGDGVVTHSAPGQYRKRVFSDRVEAPLQLTQSPIRLIAHTLRRDGSPVVAALSAEGRLAINSVTFITNFLSGEQTPSLRSSNLPYESDANRGDPTYLLVSGLGDVVYLAWEDGHLHRFDLRDVTKPLLAEKVELLEGRDATLTALRFMIGKTTIVAGDSLGNVRTFFRTKPQGAQTPDGQLLVATHDLGTGPAAVTALTSSARSRLIAAGFADGSVNLYHVTTNQLLVSGQLPSGGAIETIALSQKDDGILAVAGDRLQSWSVDPKHPAVTLTSITAPVWYEGFNTPDTTWQSSSGTDDFEPKYGLWPLVFGTLKATFYSMIFGLPIAIAAALYTSEFLHARVKARIKPIVEMMASLPSVVLGFLAALVIAPVVEHIVPGVIFCMLTIPLAVLCGAYIWQMMPQSLVLNVLSLGTRPSTATSPLGKLGSMAARLLAGVGGVRFIAIVALLFVGIAVGILGGPLVEVALFAGDVKRWLDGQIGYAYGGWMIILLPICAVVVSMLIAMLVNPHIRDRSHRWSRMTLAVVDFAKFLVGLLLVLGLALLVGLVLQVLGFDPRGEAMYDPIGRYDQRNALVVGFIMGFAIIPIIYTIAEDALSAVPEHLRAASLGAGATHWQTGVRVIIPTAMSGLFSATMIGLGRAVGETMIVLMAAGNTAVTKMNIFNGFRTLAANIAVELPEAPMGGTHYRVLFLAALTLFVMTFIVNTIAEVIRMRFRKRAFQL